MTHILEGLNFNYNFQPGDEQPPLFSLPFAGMNTKYDKERRDPGCWRRAPRRKSERTFAGPLAGICSSAKEVILPSRLWLRGKEEGRRLCVR